MTHGPALGPSVHDLLADEARALHRAIFARAAPPSVVDAYVRAHEHYCAARAHDVDVAAVLRMGADLEALELALRTRDSLLSRKARLLVYVAEGTPEGYRDLVNERDRRTTAWAAIAKAVLRTALLKGKGALLARRVARA